jgi:hypothetical protein
VLGGFQGPSVFSEKGFTMSYRYAFGAFAATVLAVSGVVAQDGLQSGPQVGKSIPGPFHPTNVTGLMAGKKHCLV